MIRAVEAADGPAWRKLYAGYRTFYELEPSDAVVTTVWGWVLAGTHGMRSLVATTEHGDVVGLANFRTFARPTRGATGIYLDDLFTDPAVRGNGYGRSLLEALARTARAEDAIVVRWITSESNSVARHLYDSVATATEFVTYDLDPAA